MTETDGTDSRRMISALAHRDHPIHAPLSDASVDRLLTRAVTPETERVLDLGCGEAAWLVRALTGRPALRAAGVDLGAEAVEEARRAVALAGLTDRIDLHQLDAREFAADYPFDLVLSVGACHVLGGLLPTLDAAARHLAPGGTVLVGDGFWEREPGPAALEALGADAGEYDDLATTVQRVREAGWTPVYGHVSSLAEWDAYEWAWTGTLARWALDHPQHPLSSRAAEAARAHQHGWLAGYRGTLGFVTLLLRRTTEDGGA